MKHMDRQRAIDATLQKFGRAVPERQPTPVLRPLEVTCRNCCQRPPIGLGTLCVQCLDILYRTTPEERPINWERVLWAICGVCFLGLIVLAFSL